MSNLRRAAELIPAEYRKEMLELNLIDGAKATADDEPMSYLVVIWQNYIEKDFKPDCDLCRSRVLRNLQAMKTHLIDMEKESNLLKSA